jgi:hypothetical protein
MNSLHSPIPFLQFLLSHLRLPSQETPSIPSQPALYPRIASGQTHREGRLQQFTVALLSVGTDRVENTAYSVEVQLSCKHACLRSRYLVTAVANFAVVA